MDRLSFIKLIGPPIKISNASFLISKPRTVLPYAFLELLSIFEKQKVMKHKYLDKYYIGEWNTLGYPEGKGVMLEPETYIYFG